jgi:FeS assembly protein IscX
MPALKWADADEIGFELYEADPDQNPLQVRFTDLRQRVLNLGDFDDGPDASSEAILEAIQMAWYETFQEEQD